MKNLVWFISLLVMSNVVIAQESGSDTTKFMLGDTQIIIIGQEGHGDSKDSTDIKIKVFNAWTGIELGINTVLTSDNSFTLPDELDYMELDHSKSLAWNINFGDVNWDWVSSDENKQFNIAKFGFISGMGLSYRNYTFSNNIALTNVDDSTFGVFDTIRNYTKNKLRTIYIRVPLMLQFYTTRVRGGKAQHGFHIAAGVVGGLKIGSSYKRKYKVDGDGKKDKEKDDFNLSSFTADAELRVGYGHLSLFASYGLVPLFKDDKGPELYSATVGISLSKLF